MPMNPQIVAIELGGSPQCKSVLSSVHCLWSLAQKFTVVVQCHRFHGRHFWPQQKAGKALIKNSVRYLPGSDPQTEKAGK